MAVNFSDHFTCKKLIKAVVPPILMMVFTSVYCIVDGVFISNFVGTTAFAAVNLIMPYLNIVGGLGFMTGTGGSALIGKTLGEGDKVKANKIFTMIMLFTLCMGVVTSTVSFIFIEPISVMLGATTEMLPDCITYGRIMMAGNVMFMLQVGFQSMLMVAERPMMSFVVTIAAGVTNIVGDAVLVGVLDFGLVGAASATLVGYGVGVIVPLVYFASKKNKSLLHWHWARFDFKVIFKACFNGASELLSTIAASVVGMLYNFQLLKYVGEDGVAAFGVIMYACFIFAAVIFGYSQGVAPIVSFNFGAKNESELRNLLRKSLIISAILGVTMTAATLGLANPLSKLFVGYDEDLTALTANGMRLFGITFLLCAFNIFGSSFFTALNNGLVSAIISFARLMVFKIVMVMVLPIWLGLNGIWVSDTFAEVLSIIVTAACLIACNKKYHYFANKSRLS